MRRPLLWMFIAVSALAALVLLGRPARQPESLDALASDAEPDNGPVAKVSAAPVIPATASQPLPTDRDPLPEVLVDPALRIEKSKRRLTVYSDGVPVKGYRIALGRQPVGDKEQEGDNRTPEGEFYVCSKNSNSAYHLALGLSYPNEEDADRGLESHLITKREHRAITAAIHRMQRPPWSTALGGEIMIHGSGATRGDWTRGCVALDDCDIDELFTAVPLGTPIEIIP